MRSFLYIVLFSVYCMTSCLSSVARLTPREDYTELKAILNISGFLSLQTPKNFTISSPMSIRLSGPVDLLISPIKTFGLRKQIVDGYDDQVVTERRSIFRKDYRLDAEKLGWFKLHRIPAKWEAARIRCELEGAELASPLDLQIYQEMKSMVDDAELSSIFTGIHSLFSYGNYYSLKGVPIEEMPIQWTPYLSSNKNQRCIALLRDTIDNVECNIALPYICYKRNDYTPLSECGTIDTEYKLNKQLNTCYKLQEEGKPWEDAFKTCSAEGGALTVINSDEEFAAVIQLFNMDTVAGQNLDYHVFVGATYSEPYGHWITIDDTKLEKSGFSTWSPNNKVLPYYGNDNNYCAALKRFGLAKIPCGTPTPFVCEKKP